MVRHPQPRRCGVAAVELAVFIPFLCFAFAVAVDYARVFYYTVTLDNCARNGAYYGSADTTHALDTSGIQSAARMDASNLSPLPTVSSTTDSSTNPTYVTVTVTYTYSTVTAFRAWFFQIPSQTTLTRSVQMSVVPATPTFN
jgi:Flp pilus assembly protein TadG